MHKTLLTSSKESLFDFENHSAVTKLIEIKFFLTRSFNFFPFIGYVIDLKLV